MVSIPIEFVKVALSHKVEGHSGLCYAFGNFFGQSGVRIRQNEI